MNTDDIKIVMREPAASTIYVSLRDDDGRVEKVTLQSWVDGVESRLRDLEADSA